MKSQKRKSSMQSLEDKLKKLTEEYQSDKRLKHLMNAIVVLYEQSAPVYRYCKVTREVQAIYSESVTSTEAIMREKIQEYTERHYNLLIEHKVLMFTEKK